MRQSIKERVLKTAEFIVEKQATVRSAAQAMGVSKSTVHSDMTVRLPYFDGGAYKEVKAILDKNKEERHIRGGENTRQKYSKMR